MMTSRDRVTADELLPVPDEVSLWLDKQEDDDPDSDTFIKQVNDAIDWVIEAAKLAHTSRELKTTLRELLTTEVFTTNLHVFHFEEDNLDRSQTCFKELKDSMTQHLSSLGKQLDDFHRLHNLEHRLGHAKFDVTKNVHELFINFYPNNVDGISQAVVMPEIASLFPFDRYDHLWMMYDQRFLHAMMMVARVADQGFQQKVEHVAAEFGMDLDSNTFIPAPPKSTARSYNKMYSDYRYRQYPTAAFNIDVIRNLCVCPLEKTESFLDALLNAFGGGAKFKFLYDVPYAERQDRFHLSSIMLTVMYEPGLTFSELFGTNEAMKILDDYCNNPKGSIPFERWKEHTVDARQLLTTNADVSLASVRILGEIQIVLPFFTKIRHQMHVPYKIFRASNSQQLYSDYMGNVDRVMDRETDISMFKACEDGRKSYIKMLLDNGANVNQARTDDGFTPLIAASAEGHSDIAKLLLDNGANVNQATTDDGRTPLYAASEEGHSDFAKLLLDNGAIPLSNRCCFVM